MVSSAESAITPRVSSMTSAEASSIEVAKWVAPKLNALSRLASTGSTTTMCSALLTMGVLEGRHIDEALNIVRKGGAVVMTAIASMADVTANLSMCMMTLFQKRLLGSLYGEANPRADIPRLLNLYRDGKLLLDETVTAEYKLNDINQGYDDMLAGRNIRGVLIHDHS
jgi:Zn-dependent alcohol dehydrogenase